MVGGGTITTIRQLEYPKASTYIIVPEQTSEIDKKILAQLKNYSKEGYQIHRVEMILDSCLRQDLQLENTRFDPWSFECFPLIFNHLYYSGKCPVEYLINVLACAGWSLKILIAFLLSVGQCLCLLHFLSLDIALVANQHHNTVLQINSMFLHEGLPFRQVCKSLTVFQVENEQNDLKLQ